MKEIKYSIVILANSSNNLDKTIESIVNQKYDLSKLQLIIVDYSEDTSVKSIIEKYKDFFNNITIKKSFHDKYINNLNKIVSEFKGEYITFITNNNYYSSNNTFNKIDKLTRKYEIISIQSEYESIDIKQRKKFLLQPTETGNVNLNDEPAKLQLYFNSYFISKNVMRQFVFDASFEYDFKIKFLIELLDKYNEYYFYNKVSIISLEQFDTGYASAENNLDKNWYIKLIEKYIYFIRNKSQVKKFIEYILVYIINTRINANIGDRNKKVLNEIELEEFFDRVVELSKFIDNSILIGYLDENIKNFKIRRWIAYYIAKRKYNDKKNISVIDNKLVLQYDNNEKIINKDVLFETINILAINYMNGKLYFDCKTSLSPILDTNEFKIKIKYCENEVEIEKSEIYSSLDMFGKTYYDTYCFSFCIDSIMDKGCITASAQIGNKELKLGFCYTKPQAHLSNSKRSYWHIENITLCNKISYIKISKSHFFSNLVSEIKYDISKIINTSNRFRVMKLIFLRWLYFITKPFYKNSHIWLTFDKLYKAGDNGEYVYQYGIKHNKNIYYIVKKNSPDYKRLVEENKEHVLVFNSLRAKLYALHSEVVLKTHANIFGFLGFDGIARILVSDLFTADIIEIQHGLTIQDIPQYQNRLVDNTKLYLIASKFEYNNIIKPAYDYSEEQIKMVGLGRYDGLKNNDQKIILITPTWRHSVAAPSLKHGVPRGHNDVFKNTEYFRIYNSLINNKDLIKNAKKNGYKIVYLLHPTLSGQIDDFDKNDSVDIIAATGNISYEKILTESSLMVTDYSGVQYDFAYQRKPILYFHPDELPPHYDSSLDYEKDGFGPIIKKEKELVKELCNKMDNNCANDIKYINRANNFFAYDDYNNCERIVNEIDKYLENKKII